MPSLPSRQKIPAVFFEFFEFKFEPPYRLLFVAPNILYTLFFVAYVTYISLRQTFSPNGTIQATPMNL